MKTETLLIGLMVLLVLMAGLQAYQITGVSQVIATGAVVSAGSSGAGTPSSSVLQSLPTQVGGC